MSKNDRSFVYIYSLNINNYFIFIANPKLQHNGIGYQTSDPENSSHSFFLFGRDMFEKCLKLQHFFTFRFLFQ